MRRRRTLACTLLTAAAVAAPVGAARAFRLERALPAEAAEWQAGACGSPPLHAALRAELSAALGGGADAAAVEDRLAALLPRCPFCGCTLAAGGATDHREAAPRPEG